MKIALLTVLTISMCTAAGDGYIDQTPDQVWGILQRPGGTIVDVSPLWDQGHIPEAISVPLDQLAQASADWDRSDVYVIYCHSDEASIQGASLLVSEGFQTVYRLEGNFSGWVDAGFPVQVQGQYMDITVQQAFDMLEMNHSLFVIDVSPLYDQGHIPGAINAPLDQLGSFVQFLDHDAPHLVYCHMDAASIQGAEILVDAGFTTVYRMEGNFSAWVDAGYPTDD